MICRHRFNGSRRLSTVVYCYYINRGRRTVDLVDLRQCTNHMRSHLIQLSNRTNSAHRTQFIHPRFDPFFKYFGIFQESFEVLTDYSVINLCLQRSYEDTFYIEVSDVQIMLPFMSEVDEQQFRNSGNQYETDYRHKYCLMSLFTCDVELVLFNLLAIFAARLFILLMDGYSSSIMPLRSVDAICFWRKLKRRLQITMMRRLSYR